MSVILAKAFARTGLNCGLLHVRAELCKACITLQESRPYKPRESSKRARLLSTPVLPDRNYCSNNLDEGGITWKDPPAKNRGQLKDDYGFSVGLKFNVLDLEEVVELIREEGGLDVVVIEVPEEMCYVKYFIVATATSPRHLSSTVEIINKLYKRKRQTDQPFAVIEGKHQSDDWQCLDLGDMIIHIMLEETREYYDLEKLWLLGAKYDDEMRKAPTSEEIMKQLAMQGLDLMSMDNDSVKALSNFDIGNPWQNEPDDFDPDDSPPDTKGHCHLGHEPDDDDAFVV